MRRDCDWVGETHTLIVRSMLAPEEVIGEEDLDYDIEHPPSCERAEEEAGDGMTVTRWDCDVQLLGVDDGLACSLTYSGTPVTEPATCKIRAWARTYSTQSGDEYDCGVAIADMRKPQGQK